MAVINNLIKNFSNFQGLDLRSSDLVRPPQFASDIQNASYNKSNAITKRKGYQYKTESSGGFGMGIYKDTDTSTGAVTEAVVSVDNSLYILTADSFNITYSGADTATLAISLNTSTSTFNIQITEGVTSIYSKDIGLGLDEASAVTVATVISEIDALTDFAASGGTTTSGSAAFLELHESTTLTSTATVVDYVVWSEANEASSNPLATTQTSKNDADFENAQFANLNNTLYVGTGYDNLMKYDGQTFYRAGMPAGGDADGSGDSGTAPTTAEDAAGSTFSQNDEYFYKFLYKQVDNKGNIIEGVLSPTSAKETIAAATADIDITVTNISSSSGFNTNGAVVNGAQNGVTTITVDSGHTLNTGDTAYFFDGNTSAYVTKVLTGTTATTITFSGSVNVADNAIISNNLRIAIYRTGDQSATSPTDDTGLTYKLVAEIPNDSIGTSTQVYTDQITDANLGAEYVTPIKAHGLPPKGRYLTTYRNQLFIAGDPTNVNTVYYSDIDSPEYFPAGDNSFLVDAFQGNKIRGLGALDTAVIVFKDQSIQAITGDIGQDSFRVDEISYGGIGCDAANSIQKIQNSLFFLSTKGVFRVTLEGVQEIGGRIEPEFTKFDVSFNRKKATSVNWIDQDKYILFVPVEGTDGSSNKYAGSDSKVYAYDYSRDAWLKWDSINAQGGFALTGDTLYFQARRLDSQSSATEFQTAVFNNYGNVNDYSDHQLAITFNYKSHWETLGDPAIYKKFLRLKIFALSSDVLDGVATPYTLTIQTEFNYNTPAPIGEFTMDFSGGSSGWGNGAWGVFPWGDAALSELKGKLKVTKTRAMRLIFKNETALEDVLISGYELEVAAPYSPFIKE